MTPHARYLEGVRKLRELVDELERLALAERLDRDRILVLLGWLTGRIQVVRNDVTLDP